MRVFKRLAELRLSEYDDSSKVFYFNDFNSNIGWIELRNTLGD